MHTVSSRQLAGAALLAMALPVQADRPISGDMASTADAGTCQVELWQERASPDRAWIVAPACGLLPGLELGVDYAALHPRDPVRSELGVGLKWAPASWKLGEATFGLKAGAGWAQPSQGSWQRTEIGVFALASVQLAPAWSVHVNAGRVRDRTSGLSGNLGYTGLVWNATEQLMVFADLQFSTAARMSSAAASAPVARAGGFCPRSSAWT